eukprot:gene28828-32017_t
MRAMLTELVNPRELLMCLGPVTHLPHAAILGTMLLVNIFVPIMFFISSRDQMATEENTRSLHRKFVLVCSNAIVLMLFVYIVFAVILMIKMIGEGKNEIIGNSDVV